MQRIELGNFLALAPAEWSVQGVITVILPSPDPSVKPNIIITKENLGISISLEDYFNRAKSIILTNPFPSYQVCDERYITVGGVRAKMMVSQWNISDIRELQNYAGARFFDLPATKRVVKQILVTTLLQDLAVNITASVPADKFDGYYDTILDRFLGSLSFNLHPESAAPVIQLPRDIS